MIKAMKKLVSAVESIPEDVEGWMPDALTDALIDAKKAIAIAEHDPYDDIFIAYGLPKQDNTSLDAICQDLQEKTYTQAMRIAELEAKLAEAEKQEPVAVIGSGFQLLWCRQDWSKGLKVGDCLYTHQQPKRHEWVGLTDEEMRELEKQFNAERVRTSDEEYLVIYPADYWDWQRAIEAKLKEKNT